MDFPLLETGKDLGELAEPDQRLAAGEPIAWRSAVSGFTDPSPDHRVLPNPDLAGMYAELRTSYAILEILHKDRAPVC